MKNRDLGKEFKDGEVICKEGDEGKSMFVIQSGKVKITKKCGRRRNYAYHT